MTGSNGYSKQWTYNDLCQMVTETVDGFKKTFSYSQNLVTSVAYSKDNSYICSENFSHMNGHLTSIMLGNILTGQIDIEGVDVGNPLLAMHSVRETASCSDHIAMIEVMKRFFS